MAFSQGTSQAITGLSITGAGRLGFYIDYSELSAAGTHRFYVTRTHGTTGAVGCTFTSSGDTHSTDTATLSWADGEVDVKYIDVPVTSGNLSTHEGNGLGDHRVVATLSSATGGAAIHNGDGTTRAYGVIDTGAIASDANAVFYDSAAGTGDGTAANPYGSIYTAIANVGSKRYIYGKGTTIPDGTNKTSLLGDGEVNCIDLPLTRTNEDTRLFIQNWPGNTWTVTGNGGTTHKGFSGEARAVDYQTLRGITFIDLDCTTTDGYSNGCALYLAQGSTSSFINVERCTSSDINGSDNNAMVRAETSDNLKIWACTSDNVRTNGDAENNNTAAITLFYSCKNVSVQRCKGSNSKYVAWEKRPNDGTAPALSMRFCTNGLNQLILFSIGHGGGGTARKWSICQNNVVAGVTKDGNSPNFIENPVGIFTTNTPVPSELHHWSNNTFYYAGSGELGAIDNWTDDVIIYNNLYYDPRIAIHDRKNSTGSGSYLYLDYEQSFRPSWAEIYWEGSSSTWAAVTAATTFADNISTADPNFVDTVDFIPQNSDALTGGVGGTERGYRLTGVEIIGPVGLQAEGSVVSSAAINASGNTLTIELSEVLTVAGGGLNDVDFAITGGGTLSSVTLDASGNTITATISPVVEAVDGNLAVTYTQPGSGLQASAVDVASFEAVVVNGSTVDTTAPVLSSTTGTTTGTTTATGTVDTDEGGGFLWYTVTTGPTDTSGNILAGTSQAVSGTGTQIVNATSLTASTGYYFHFIHRDAASNVSNKVDSPLFTTFSSTAPTLLGGFGNPFIPVFSASGSVLTLTFSEAVTTSVATGLTLSTGEVLTYSSGSTTNTIVYDVFPYAQVGGAILNFAGGADLIESTASGVDVEAFSDFIVNGISVSSPPVLVGTPSVNVTGTLLTFSFNEAVDNLPSPIHSAFTLTGSGILSNPFVSSTLVGGNASFVISPAVEVGETLTLDFVQAGGEFTGPTTGIGVESFSIQPVNNSTVDTLPPVFTSAPVVSKTTLTGHTIRQTINKAGTVYGVQLPSGSGFPEPFQVKAGTDELGTPALAASSVAATADTPCVIVFSSGAKNTEYDYYIVAEDSVPNLQESVVKVTATTENLLFNGSGGGGLPAAGPKKKVKMKWEESKRKGKK